MSFIKKTFLKFAMHRFNAQSYISFDYKEVETCSIGIEIDNMIWDIEKQAVQEVFDFPISFEFNDHGLIAEVQSHYPWVIGMIEWDDIDLIDIYWLWKNI